ncbi:MAG: hypothetical protein ACC628_28140 [Pirellulaceae bacterium]
METLTLNRGSPLSEVDFVAFDLETTGLHAIACRTMNNYRLLKKKDLEDLLEQVEQSVKGNIKRRRRKAK